ncbi:hypothetical protein FRB90_003429 [Tulasnella sp. 427]|nr:hypothetical protein FRB90_003429 [Tulasnella sp. 427]
MSTAGKSSDEAETFIRQVNLLAFKAQKTRDAHWTADLASTAFAGDALRKFLRWAPEIRGDWNKLQEALLNEYPPSSAPMGAAAPPPPAYGGLALTTTTGPGDAPRGHPRLYKGRPTSGTPYAGIWNVLQDGTVIAIVRVEDTSYALSSVFAVTSNTISVVVCPKYYLAAHPPGNRLEARLVFEPMISKPRMATSTEGAHPPAAHAPQPQLQYEAPLGSKENYKPKSPEPAYYPPAYTNVNPAGRSELPWAQADQGYPHQQAPTYQPRPPPPLDPIYHSTYKDDDDGTSWNS